MRRHLFNVVALLSFALCVATVALWIRSRTRVDWFAHATSPDEGPRQVQHAFGSDTSLLYYQRIRPPARPGPGWRWFPPGFRAGSGAPWRDELRPNADRYGHRFGGFGYYYVVQNNPRNNGFPLGMGFLGVFVPHGAVAVIFGIPPALAVVRHVRPRRTRATHCQRCGYDLRATPSRCPECGAVPAVK